LTLYVVENCNLSCRL